MMVMVVMMSMMDRSVMMAVSAMAGPCHAHSCRRDCDQCRNNDFFVIHFHSPFFAFQAFTYRVGMPSGGF
jgi:hypothetical protein